MRRLVYVLLDCEQDNEQRLTFIATQTRLRTAGRLISYPAQLRHDQQPIAYVYMSAEFEIEFAAMPGTPCGEDPETAPADQVQALLTRFCAGGEFVRDYHYDRRGKKPLWQWKTRSVRIMGLYGPSSNGQNPTTFVALHAAYKKGLKTKPFYQRASELATELGLMTLAFDGDEPHAEED